MKKLLPIVITLLLYINTSAQFVELPPLRNGGDKILHLSASYVISYNTYNFIEPRYGHKRALTYSILASLVIGIGKEIYDERYSKGWEKGDMYANGIGITLFVIDKRKPSYNIPTFE